MQENLVETVATFNIMDANWTRPLTAEQNETLRSAVASTLAGLPDNYNISLGTVLVGLQASCVKPNVKPTN